MEPSDSSAAAGLQQLYDGMKEARRSMIRPMVIFVLVFYFLLPVLTNFTSVLDGVAFTGVTWAYLYAFSQFAVVIVLTTIYRRRMDAAERKLRPAEVLASTGHPVEGSSGPTRKKAVNKKSERQEPSV